ncbi:MAG: sodium-dependent bicarbonate transport family permease [Bacteroidota bacterium]
MDLSIFLDNLSNPAILFFFLGVFAVAIRSDLNIPSPISKFLSYYLLFCIGLHGGEELAHNGLTAEMFRVLGLAIILSLVVPIYTYFILKRRLNAYDAGAIAATYGSISAVTFITAVNFLQGQEASFDGYMVAAMALMEAPAIIVGLVLINLSQPKTNGTRRRRAMQHALKEAATNGSVVLILGSVVIGALASDKHLQAIEPFTGEIFKGMLVFFLLDMGLLAAKRMGALRKQGIFLLGFSILVPLLNAALVIGVCSLLHISQGNTLLLTVLGASASYIAVPAAMRITVPKANAGLYVSMSLAMTFPFNIIVGIPLYYYVIQLLMP